MRLVSGIVGSSLNFLVVVHMKSNSSLDFELLCWAKRPHDQGKLMHELNTGIYNAFNNAGIEIPFPQREVHLKNEPEN